MKVRLAAVLMMVSMMMVTPVYAADQQLVSYEQGKVSDLGAWELMADGEYKFKGVSGEYVTSAWIESQTEVGVWFFVGADGVMMKGETTPDGYWVNDVGEYRSGSDSTSTTDNTQHNNGGKRSVLDDPGVSASPGHSRVDGSFNGTLNGH